MCQFNVRLEEEAEKLILIAFRFLSLRISPLVGSPHLSLYEGTIAS
jgi:hypothetical protein